MHFHDKEELYSTFINDFIDRIKRTNELTVSNISDFNIYHQINYINELTNELEKEKKLLKILLSDKKNDFHRKLSDAIYEVSINTSIKYSKLANNIEYRLYCRFWASGLVDFISDSMVLYELPLEEIKRILQIICNKYTQITIEFLKKIIVNPNIKILIPQLSHNFFSNLCYQDFSFKFPVS